MVSKLRKVLEQRSFTAPALTLTTSSQGDRRTIRANGELDGATRDEFFNACIDGTHTRIVVDLGELTFMDCGGYAAVLELVRAAESSGRTVTIRNEVGQPARLLQLIAELPR